MKGKDMTEKTIAVRLHPRLEGEGRGFCDPDEPRNGEVITQHNYGGDGYLIVYPSGFIRAQIRAGMLIEVPVKNISDPKGESSVKKAGRGVRKPGKTKS
jgi:hypothetical protein